MRVKRSVAVTEGEATSDEIEAIAAEEGVFNRAHRRIAIDFSELGEDKFAICQDVDEQAKLVQQVHR